MSFFLKRFFFTVLVVLLATPAFCEYYKYTDQSGVVRFTDNLAVVPIDQRPHLETYESTASNPVQTKTKSTRKSQGDRASISTENNSASWQEKISRQTDELDRMKQELEQTYTKLQKEQVALEAQAPAKWASSNEVNTYVERVEALNARIERYETKRAEFEEKVNQFNAKLKK